MMACGPACAFFAGTMAGVILDHLFAASDAEQQAAEQEDRLRRVLLELDFAKGVRRLEELNAIRSSKSKAPLGDAKILLTEARSFFLNASATKDLPLLSVRSDCYVGSCNALLLQPDLHNYERAYGTCAQMEHNYVYDPPGFNAPAKPEAFASISSCAMYNRRRFLYLLSCCTPHFGDFYKKPMELYQHMGPLATLLKARGSHVDGVTPENKYTFEDRYLNLYAEAHERAMHCPSK